MTDAQHAVRRTRAAENTLVIISKESGFHVYSASDPSRAYEVTEEDGRWMCTCPDFGYHASDPNWRCKHILAAVPQAPNGMQEADGNGTAVMPTTAAAGNSNGHDPSAAMLIKRSVSPDGRIDSVSVEFTLPVGGDSQRTIKDKAFRTLGIQDEIVGHFLGAKSNGSGQDHSPDHNHGNGTRTNGNGHSNGYHRPDEGTIPARIIEVGEVQGKWGPRLCLIFQVNGSRARIFGSAKQLAARIGDAGFDYAASSLRAGLRLNLDCLVTTQPSNDGKYLNVDQVHPLHVNGGGR